MFRQMIAAGRRHAALALALAATTALADESRPRLRDDARVQAAVEYARGRFLPAGRLDRLDVTVLLAAPDGSWRRGSVGGGFPHCTVYESKIGDAYDTLAEIVHAELPDGRGLIVAAFSNGRDRDGPDEQDLTALAGFAKLLLERVPPPDE